MTKNPPVPKYLRAYLAGDVGHVAMSCWLATSGWLMRVFPDLHIVTLVSKIKSGPELMRWWNNQVVVGRLPVMDERKQWEPAHSPQQIVETLFISQPGYEIFSALSPDWPSITAGGCRFIHTARSFLVDCLPILRQLEADMWPEMYLEQYHLYLFGRREVPAQPSPTSPVSSPSICLNPDMTGMLQGPSRNITSRKLSEAVAPGYGLRGIILEYARAYPLEGAKFLSRLESTPDSAAQMLPHTTKAYELVWSLQDLMSLLGIMPSRPSQWEDTYPLWDPKSRIQRIEERAESTLTRNLSQVASSSKKPRRLRWPS